MWHRTFRNSPGMKTDSFHTYVLEHLGAVKGVRSRPMFGGFGFYLAEEFFAIVYKGRLYMKTDAAMRARCTAAGMEPFTPRMGQPARSVTMKQYYEVPADVLEDPDQLADWARRAAQIKSAT